MMGLSRRLRGAIVDIGHSGSQKLLFSKLKRSLGLLSRDEKWLIGRVKINCAQICLTDSSSSFGVFCRLQTREEMTKSCNHDDGDNHQAG